MTEELENNTFIGISLPRLHEEIDALDKRYPYGSTRISPEIDIQHVKLLIAWVDKYERLPIKGRNDRETFLSHAHRRLIQNGSTVDYRAKALDIIQKIVDGQDPTIEKKQRTTEQDQAVEYDLPDLLKRDIERAKENGGKSCLVVYADPSLDIVAGYVYNILGDGAFVSCGKYFIRVSWP